MRHVWLQTVRTWSVFIRGTATAGSRLWAADTSEEAVGDQECYRLGLWQRPRICDRHAGEMAAGPQHADACQHAHRVEWRMMTAAGIMARRVVVRVPATWARAGRQNQSRRTSQVFQPAVWFCLPPLPREAPCASRTGRSHCWPCLCPVALPRTGKFNGGSCVNIQYNVELSVYPYGMRLAPARN